MRATKTRIEDDRIARQRRLVEACADAQAAIAAQHQLERATFIRRVRRRHFDELRARVRDGRGVLTIAPHSPRPTRQRRVVESRPRRNRASRLARRFSLREESTHPLATLRSRLAQRAHGSRLVLANELRQRRQRNRCGLDATALCVRMSRIRRSVSAEAECDHGDQQNREQAAEEHLRVRGPADV